MRHVDKTTIYLKCDLCSKEHTFELERFNKSEDWVSKVLEEGWHSVQVSPTPFVGVEFCPDCFEKVKRDTAPTFTYLSTIINDNNIVGKRALFNRLCEYLFGEHKCGEMNDK